VAAAVLLSLLYPVCAGGQTAPAPVSAPTDAVLDAAEALVGRALFLRGLYLANDLSFDAAGRVSGAPKAGDWTLAGMNVLKAERRGPKTIELDGVRVAIRYNTDNHQFERHPQNDEKMKLLVDDPGGLPGWNAAVDKIFAQGIDPGLQRAMPPFWQHYFNPTLAWPQDTLTGQTIYALFGQPDQAKDVIPPTVLRKTDSKMTSFAEHDKVHGVLQLRMVIDTQGVPRRIAIVRPLGYGLDEQAVEAVAKWQFRPGMRGGQPVAVEMLLNYDFEFVAPPHP